LEVAVVEAFDVDLGDEAYSDVLVLEAERRK
jgi:hypothetical protein